MSKNFIDRGCVATRPVEVIAITDSWTTSKALQDLLESVCTFLKRPFHREEFLRATREAVRCVELFRMYAKLKQYVNGQGEPI